MDTNKIKLWLAGMSLILFSCGSKNSLINGEGFVEVTGGKIWYSVTGRGNKLPVVILHGGPGGTCYYLNPLKVLGKERQVIMFDQLGCGRSDRITDTALININSYVEQIKKLLDHLGIKAFYLYGHSWGSMLATEYYLKYPNGVKALVLASPILSATLWKADADTLISHLPNSISSVLKNDRMGIKQDSAVFNQAMSYYIQTYGARKRPLSSDFDSAISQQAQNVFEHLWGPSEFESKGTLKNYDRTNDLQKIRVPVLYLFGEFDEITPGTVQYYQSLTPGSIMAMIKNAGHMTMQDNPTENIKTITHFLSDQDKKQP